MNLFLERINAMDSLLKYNNACNFYKLNNQYLNIGIFDQVDTYKKQLEDDGFVIIRNLVDLNLISEIKSFWVNNITNYISFSNNLCFGEKNYTKNFFNKYQRHFDFYWNEPTNKITRELSLQLHFFRNIFTGYSPYYGLHINSKKFGVYLAITRYPSGTGEMAVHVDPNSFLPVHYNLPLSIKGEDYDEGGLFIKQNEKFTDVDRMVSKGDLILFNGSVPHKIETIKNLKNDKSKIGRLQMFSVPTFFSQNKKNSFMKNLVFEVYGRFKYYLYSQGKGLDKNYKNLR